MLNKVKPKGWYFVLKLWVVDNHLLDLVGLPHTFVQVILVSDPVPIGFLTALCLRLKLGLGGLDLGQGLDNTILYVDIEYLFNQIKEQVWIKVLIFEISEFYSMHTRKHVSTYHFTKLFCWSAACR